MCLFDDFVERAIADRVFVNVERPNYETDGLMGILVQQSEDFIELVKFDQTGEYDGLSIIRKDDVLSMRRGGNELSSFDRLLTDQTGIVQEGSVDLTSIRSVVESVFKQFGYVGVFQEEYDSAFDLGEVIAVDDDFVSISAYGTAKSLDRSKVLLRLDSISRVDVDGKYEKSIFEIFSTIE